MSGDPVSAQASLRTNLSLSTESVSRIAIAVTWAAILALVMTHDRPPLVDWPNHMARHYLEALWLSGQQLPDSYQIGYGVMPNLGSDLIVPILLLVVSPIAASKIFLALAIVLFWAGPAAYVMQYSKDSSRAWIVSALVMPWLLAGTFFWGFVNYYSGVGVAFLAAANHIRLDRKASAPAWQYAAHAALLVLLYFWHLAAIGIYLVLAGCYMLDRLVRAGFRAAPRTMLRAAPMLLAMVPALSIMMWVMLTPKLNALAGGVEWSTPLRKLILAFGYFGAYDLWTDVPLMTAWGLLLLLLFRLELPRKLGLDYVGLSAIAFAILYLVLPVEVGTTSGADIRMLPPLFFLVAALLVNLPVARTATLGIGLLALIGLVRYGAIHTAWASMEGDARAITTHFGQAPKNARILVLTLDRASKTSFQSHVIGWAVPAGDAYVSSLFSYAGQQPLSLKRQPSEATVRVVDHRPILDTNAVGRDFDYVWLFNPSGVDIDLPAGWRYELGQGAGKLYKLR